MTGEKYLTFATWGLVIATFLLYLDGRSKGKEQRRRWEKEDKDRERERNELRSRWTREDEIRKSQEALNYRFGVKPRDDGEVVVWVANLGTTSFLVTRVWLDITNPFDSTQRLLRKKGFEWNAVVTAGETKDFVMPEGYLLGSPVDKDEHSCHKYEFSIGIDHLGKQEMSPVKTFDVVVDEAKRLEMFSKPFAE